MISSEEPGLSGVVDKVPMVGISGKSKAKHVVTENYQLSGKYVKDYKRK